MTMACVQMAVKLALDATDLRKKEDADVDVFFQAAKEELLASEAWQEYWLSGCPPQGVHEGGLGSPSSGQQRVASGKDYHLSLGKGGPNRKNRHQPLAEGLTINFKAGCYQKRPAFYRSCF